MSEEPHEEQERFSRGLPRTPEFDAVWQRQAARRSLGRRLEQIRRAAGLNQTELAERMGKDQAFVARMESGRGDMPKAENVALFAKHCGYVTAYAFVERGEDDGLTLHELEPIGASVDVAAELAKVHDVTLLDR